MNTYKDMIPVTIVSKENGNLETLEKLLENKVLAFYQIKPAIVHDFHKWLELFGGADSYAMVYIADSADIECIIKRKHHSLVEGKYILMSVSKIPYIKQVYKNIGDTGIITL